MDNRNGPFYFAPRDECVSASPLFTLLGYVFSKRRKESIFTETISPQDDHIVPHNRHFSTGVLTPGLFLDAFSSPYRVGGSPRTLGRLMFQRQGALANSGILRRP